MRILKTIAISLFCSLLIVGPIGCSQAKVSAAVADIGKWTPVIASDTSALLADVASFEPADAAQIQGFITVLNNDANTLTTLCNQYIATPTTGLLNQITAFVGTMAASDSSAIVALLQIKDSNSQMIAKGILTAIATALTIVSTLLQGVGVQLTAGGMAAIQSLKPYADRATLSGALQLAKDQGIAPRQLTLAELGY